MMIKLIVGLGNPGSKYELNRHNVGFWLVDFLALQYGGVWKSEAKFFGLICKIRIENQEVLLLKPTTFMNDSGKSVASITRFFKLSAEHIIVAHDELDIPITSIKFKKSGGHGGHNGLRSIIGHIGKDFYRVRIGIDRPSVGDVSSFVLNNPSSKEQEVIVNNIKTFTQLAPQFIAGDIDNATQQLHTKH
jgi:PTH1 family peptidyl-tRNA hydrolase